MSSTSVQPTSDQPDVIDLEDTMNNTVDKHEDEQAKLGQSDLSLLLYIGLIAIISLVECLCCDWTSPIYAFYEPIPQIGSTKDNRPFHEFICAKKGCGKRIQRYLDKGNAKSTSNLKKHAIHCWKEHVVQSALDANNLKEACKVVAEHWDGVFTSHFECIGKGKVTYSSIQPTKAETR